MEPDLYVQHVDVTADCGATVSAPSWSRGRVRLCMGGDLSMSIVMHPNEARELGGAFIAAAEAAEASA
jgi:hypothetical protein